MKYWSPERNRFEDSKGNEVREVSFSEELRGPDMVAPDWVAPDGMKVEPLMEAFRHEIAMEVAKGTALDKHYTDMKIQPMAFALANNLDPAQQTILKYISRYRVKHGVRDLKAAAVVLEKYIEYVESGETKWDGQPV